MKVGLGQNKSSVKALKVNHRSLVIVLEQVLKEKSRSPEQEQQENHKNPVMVLVQKVDCKIEQGQRVQSKKVQTGLEQLENHMNLETEQEQKAGCRTEQVQKADYKIGMEQEQKAGYKIGMEQKAGYKIEQVLRVDCRIDWELMTQQP